MGIFFGFKYKITRYFYFYYLFLRYLSPPLFFFFLKPHVVDSTKIKKIRNFVIYLIFFLKKNVHIFITINYHHPAVISFCIFTYRFILKKKKKSSIYLARLCIHKKKSFSCLKIFFNLGIKFCNDY